MEYLLYLVGLAFIAAGIAGTVIPAIPGLPLIFAGGWLIGWASDYELIGVIGVVVLALLAAVGVGIDMLAQIMGAKKAGASKAGLWGAAAGTLLGLVTGVFGLVFFPLVGAMVGEILAGRDWLRAGKVGIATWLGMVVGTAVKLAIAFSMLGLIVFSVFTHSAAGHFFSHDSDAANASSADVPQAPGDAAPIVGHPGKPEPGRYSLSRAPESSAASDAAADAAQAQPQAEASPAAEAPAAPDTRPAPSEAEAEKELAPAPVPVASPSASNPAAP